MIARLWVTLRHWVRIGLFGWSERCMYPGCGRDGEWAHPDGGPGAACTRHLEEVGQ